MPKAHSGFGMCSEHAQSTFKAQLAQASRQRRAFASRFFHAQQLQWQPGLPNRTAEAFSGPFLFASPRLDTPKNKLFPLSL